MDEYTELTVAAPIGVAFLARGGSGGFAAAHTFLEAYRQHPAGHPHQLYILAKNWDDKAEYQALSALFSEVPAKIIDLPDDGFDWGAYFRAAPLIVEKWLCFLNTHSIIQTDGWLHLMAKGACQSDVGVAGCTGSYGSIANSFRFIRLIAADFDINGRGWLRRLFWYRHFLFFPFHYLKDRKVFPLFPNPHLRSTSFLISKALFIQFARHSIMPQSKYEAFQLESGYEGLTRFIHNQNKKAVVAGADGHIYDVDQCQNSRRFRVPRQDNLLVSDNQTRAYEEAGPAMRRILELTAWGEFITQYED